MQIVRSANGTCQVSWRLIAGDGTNLCGNVFRTPALLSSPFPDLHDESKVHREVIRLPAHFSRRSAAFRCSRSVALDRLALLLCLAYFLRSAFSLVHKYLASWHSLHSLEMQCKCRPSQTWHSQPFEKHLHSPGFGWDFGISDQRLTNKDLISGYPLCFVAMFWERRAVALCVLSIVVGWDDIVRYDMIFISVLEAPNPAVLYVQPFKSLIFGSNAMHLPLALHSPFPLLYRELRFAKELLVILLFLSPTYFIML